MDKIEKIRAKIERRINELVKDKYINIDAKACRVNELSSLKRFLDTLSEEPDKSLEEEVKNYFQGYFPGTETIEQCNTDLHFTPPAIIRLARHFAEWQYQKDREEFAKIKAKTWCEGFDAHKSQMMKEAVEGLICATVTGTNAISFFSPLPKELTAGDKVRIVVLKEEEE